MFSKRLCGIYNFRINISYVNYIYPLIYSYHQFIELELSLFWIKYTYLKTVIKFKSLHWMFFCKNVRSILLSVAIVKHDWKFFSFHLLRTLYLYPQRTCIASCNTKGRSNDHLWTNTAFFIWHNGFNTFQDKMIYIENKIYTSLFWVNWNFEKVKHSVSFKEKVILITVWKQSG